MERGRDARAAVLRPVLAWANIEGLALVAIKFPANRTKPVELQLLDLFEIELPIILARWLARASESPDRSGQRFRRMSIFSVRTTEHH